MLQLKYLQWNTRWRIVQCPVARWQCLLLGLCSKYQTTLYTDHRQYMKTKQVTLLSLRERATAAHKSNNSTEVTFKGHWRSLKCHGSIEHIWLPITVRSIVTMALSCTTSLILVENVKFTYLTCIQRLVGGGRSLRISQRCSVAGKLEWWGYHADSSLIIAVSTQYRNVTDGWTDRQNYHYQYRALAVLLWRRKQSHIKLECCVQTAQTSAKTKIPAKSHPGFESRFSGLIHIRIPMSAGSLPKCCGLSASVISWKSTGDCVKNANKSPQIPSSAMVGWGGEE